MISWWSFVPFFSFDRSLNSTNKQPVKSRTAPPCTRRWSWAGPGSAATQLPANMLRETPAQCGSSHYFKVPWLAFTHASAQTPKQLVFSSASTCCSSVIFRLQSLCLPFSTLCITTLTVFPTLCLLLSYPLSSPCLQLGCSRAVAAEPGATVFPLPAESTVCSRGLTHNKKPALR